MTGMDDIANGQQVMRCKVAALPTAGPPPQRIAMTAYNGQERNQRLTVKDIVMRSSRKGLGAERIDGGGDGNGGCEGEGVGVGIMGGQPTNLGVAILA